LAQRLADAGGQTFVARDRSQAAEQIKAQDFEPNVVIVDCSLGENAISELSALSRSLPRSTTVLLFSPFERREFGDAMLKDFDGWLVKPIRLESVVEKLAHLFNFEGRKDRAAVADACTPSLSGKHILLAEDNDVNALLVERQLSKLGATVLRARDGEDAVRFVKRSFAGSIRSFAAVLMDLRMPNLDGLSATKQIRAIETSLLRPPVQIIALTANAFDEDRDAAIRAGIQTFMTKPVDLTALVGTLLKER
jgi:CheY-like chemotaxis protein